MNDAALIAEAERLANEDLISKPRWSDAWLVAYGQYCARLAREGWTPPEPEPADEVRRFDVFYSPEELELLVKNGCARKCTRCRRVIGLDQTLPMRIQPHSLG